MKTRKMTIKLFMDNIEINSYDFHVNHTWFMQVRGLVREKIEEIIKDFDVRGFE